MLEYTLTVKVGGVYRLLRNFSVDQGLVKNVRVVVIGTGSRLITIHLLQDAQTPEAHYSDILLPQIIFKD